MARVGKYETRPNRCGCPDWRFRPDTRPCKHVRALRDAVAVLREWQDANPDSRAVDLLTWNPVVPERP